MENNPNQIQKDDIPFIPDTMVQPVQRKSHLDKLAEVFLPEDLDSIGKRVFDQVIIPNILKSAGDILHKSIDLIFGTNYSGINTQPVKTETQASSWNNYRNPTTVNQSRPGTMQIMQMRSGVYDYSEVRFKSIEDARRTLNNMRAVISNTGVCSVGKYLEFAGANTIAEDFNYGWTNLDKVDAQETGDLNYPYRLLLPPTVALSTIRRTYQL